MTDRITEGSFRHSEKLCSYEICFFFRKYRKAATEPIPAMQRTGTTIPIILFFFSRRSQVSALFSSLLLLSAIFRSSANEYVSRKSVSACLLAGSGSEEESVSVRLVLSREGIHSPGLHPQRSLPDGCRVFLPAVCREYPLKNHSDSKYPWFAGQGSCSSS